ncbi:RNA polymerase-associated protein CTR9 homolog isoform X2 [Jatropha curcas]|uniref:RNA polymerase-associated protein CTR9 homolog isoform X2 n=1 Tax=Jatropha curcas TaxID=180498 RepID=UPI0005FBA5F0|nr:RNA polymerase-associated protein CTR9 homolog isoform X2 [Jatropha curcas]
MYLRQIAANVLKRVRNSTQSINHRKSINSFSNLLSSKTSFSYKYGYGKSSSRVNHKDHYLWSIIVGPAAIILGENDNAVFASASNDSGTETESEGTNTNGLRKIEDGSVISNEHTSKWRIFTDNGREYFVQGKLEQAEKFFFSALEEAKKGFGDRDPHVASACNNLAELYRVKKAFGEAEPLYLEAINILEESFGPEDIRVGAAYHNLGQFYLVQRKLEEARKCYEHALKIKGRVLGLGHADYADTMYHLGTVLYLQGKEQDAEVLIQESIRILEEAGQGESGICTMRLRNLAQMYLKSNNLEEAEKLQRKILHIMEVSKGWNSMDTVIAAERLALTLQSAGSLKEAQELLQRCLETRKTLLPDDHIQIGANMLHIARVAMLNANRLRRIHVSEAISELDKAKELLCNSTRIAQQVLKKLRNQSWSRQKAEVSEETRRHGRAALVILMQSLETVGLVELAKQELQESMQEHPSTVETASALFQCISAYKEFESERSISDSPEVKVEYLSCLKHLLSLISDKAIRETQLSGKVTSQELNDEIKRIEGEISNYRKRKTLR